jgi:glutathione S-transferase
VFLPALAMISKALANIEEALSDGEDWRLGPFTMVDVMMMAHFHRLEDVALGGVLDHELLPRTAAYWRRLQTRPAYQKAIIDWHEPHWRSGIDQLREADGSVTRMDRLCT